MAENIKLTKTGKPDKRSQVSRENAKKARQEKLKKLYSQPKVQEYEIEDESYESETESESEEEQQSLIIQPVKNAKKNPKKKTHIPDENSLLKQEISAMKQMLMQINSRPIKKKKAKPRTKKVIQMVAPPQNYAPVQSPQPVKSDSQKVAEALSYKLLKF